MKQTTYLLLLVLFINSCQTTDPLESIPNEYKVIPQPVSLTSKMGKFIFTADTKILLASNDDGLRLAAEYLQQLFPQDLKTIEEGHTVEDVIIFNLDPAIENAEGYELKIDPYEISINAKTGAGAFYAVQTLWQLLNTTIKNGEKKYFPCVEIKDAPRYPYRGMHLDVGRHFFPVDFIKKYIDLLAKHKFNNFHWHLTEDQGWRLEIKKYPKLQEIAACRSETLIGHYSDQPHKFDGKKYCGFYTQEEAREIVKYAADRFINVIPEIEMPGHAMAAIAAYPELGCTGQQIETAKIWGVHEDVYCPNEVTFDFLENVLLEVMDIFPSKYIHIGGDECPKAQWKASQFCQNLIREKGLKDEHGLQSYFIQRMEKFLNSHGRSIIGWDEILEGGLAPNATVMSWRGIEGGIAAAKQGHDVIMTPTSHCYLDYYQSESPDEPLAIGGYLPLEKVYNYEPTPTELTSEEAKHVLGAQGNVWTEYMKTSDYVEYMTYPRACAIAEFCWSQKEAKNYDDFISRLSRHLKRLNAIGVNAANKIYDVKTSILSGDGQGVRVNLSPKMDGIDLRYTLDGGNPTADSPIYSEAIAIDKSGTFQAAPFEGNEAVGSPAKIIFNLHKAIGKKITFAEMPAEKYSGNGPGSIINGVAGSDERYGGAEWLGFEGKDFEAVIDLGEETTFSKIATRFFNGKGQWIYPPKSMSVAISNDGENFSEKGKINVQDGEGKIIKAQVNLGETTARYLKVSVKNFGIIPDGAQGAGHRAWLFVDEVVVE